MSSAKRRDIAQVQSEGPQLEPGRARAGGVWTEPRDCSLSSLCEPLGALLGSLLAQGGDSDRASSKPASASSQSHRCLLLPRVFVAFMQCVSQIVPGSYQYDNGFFKLSLSRANVQT